MKNSLIIDLAHGASSGGRTPTRRRTRIQMRSGASHAWARPSNAHVDTAVLRLAHAIGGCDERPRFAPCPHHDAVSRNALRNHIIAHRLGAPAWRTRKLAPAGARPIAMTLDNRPCPRLLEQASAPASSAPRIVALDPTLPQSKNTITVRCGARRPALGASRPPSAAEGPGDHLPSSSLQPIRPSPRLGKWSARHEAEAAFA